MRLLSVKQAIVQWYYLGLHTSKAFHGPAKWRRDYS